MKKKTKVARTFRLKAENVANLASHSKKSGVPQGRIVDNALEKELVEK